MWWDIFLSTIIVVQLIIIWHLFNTNQKVYELYSDLLKEHIALNEIVILNFKNAGNDNPTTNDLRNVNFIDKEKNDE